MEMSYALVQQQVQKLVMTPELRQAIHLLQLSTADLVEYVQVSYSESCSQKSKQKRPAKRLIQEVQTSNPILAAMTMTGERFFDDGPDIDGGAPPIPTPFRPCSTHKIGTVDGRKIPYGAEACL